MILNRQIVSFETEKKHNLDLSIKSDQLSDDDFNSLDLSDLKDIYLPEPSTFFEMVTKENIDLSKIQQKSMKQFLSVFGDSFPNPKKSDVRGDGMCGLYSNIYLLVKYGIGLRQTSLNTLSITEYRNMYRLLLSSEKFGIPFLEKINTIEYNVLIDSLLLFNFTLDVKCSIAIFSSDGIRFYKSENDDGSFLITIFYDSGHYTPMYWNEIYRKIVFEHLIFLTGSEYCFIYLDGIFYINYM